MLLCSALFVEDNLDKISLRRVRLIKSRPTTAQMSNSDSQAAADVEESSLPNSPVPRGNFFESGEAGSNITTSAVGTEGPEVPPQGELEKESRDFNPDLDELVKKGVKPKTPWEVNCMVYVAASIL